MTSHDLTPEQVLERLRAAAMAEPLTVAESPEAREERRRRKAAYREHVMALPRPSDLELQALRARASRAGDAGRVWECDLALAGDDYVRQLCADALAREKEGR